jgi:hypothetical protein
MLESVSHWTRHFRTYAIMEFFFKKKEREREREERKKNERKGKKAHSWTGVISRKMIKLDTYLF